ncbi:MAG: hypothetical protein JST81_00240 [Bacteroidetes bacterium]|nr:hypothetical protein [Bacteroidota bacterium]
MKKIKLLSSIALLLVMAAGCKKDGMDDDVSFLNTVSHGTVSKIFNVTNDNTGKVTISPQGDGFTQYSIDYGDNSGIDTILVTKSAVHNYAEGNYNVVITGYDLAGKSDVQTFPLSVIYRAPENLQVNIASDVQVSATADYANWFLVYYGDVANETPTRMEVGQTLPPHIYPNGGPYNLTVIAQSGGAATTQEVKTMFGLPLSFDVATMNYFFGTFGGVNFNTVANPAPGGINTSAMVGKYEKPGGAETWSGTYSPLNIPMNLAYGKKIHVDVYNPDPANIGKLLNIELEAAVSGTGATPNGVGVLKMPITTSGAWEELVFDFNSIPAIGSDARFNQLVLRFNDAASGAGEVIYLDNFRITN